MRKTTLGLVTAFSVMLLGCGQKREEARGGAQPAAAPTEAHVEIDSTMLTAFAPLPESFDSPDNPSSEAKINLGRKLFYETKLSLSGKISCNSCHDLNSYGVDGKKVSEGHEGQLGKRNANTVYNAAGQFVQFWDGRAPTVEEQAKGPIVNPVEMAMPDAKQVMGKARLEKVPEYVQAFKAAFPEEPKPITFDNVAKAIGVFERKLVTPSRWDNYLKGDKQALTNQEKLGFKKFMQTGCMTCHMGPLVGGTMYQKLGLVEPWPTTADLGRYEHTQQDGDKMFFKVPTLRNVEKTAPYFHDGSTVSLEEATRLMAKHQLGKVINKEDTDLIVAWMKTLTGDIPKEYITLK